MEKVNTELRTIILNPDLLNDNNTFSTNSIKTAKYNIYTFLPFALIYQFTNYFNVYFLIVTIILSIREITGMNWTIGVIPYLVVIGLSLVREGIENYKKWKYDDKYNNSKAIKYNESSKLSEEVKWMDLKVGNIIKISKNESIPADVLIIKSSNANGLGYLETTNLDGESTLKPREAVAYFSSQIKLSTIGIEKTYSSIRSPFGQESKDILQLTFLSKQPIIRLDQPNKNIYQIDGYITDNSSSNDNQIFFTINNILLRGGTLKNVDFVYGIIIYCGKETKLMQNINNFSYKHSSIERTVNVIVLYVMGITFLICIIGAIIGNYNEKTMYNSDTFYLFKSKEFHEINYGLNGLKYFGTYFAIFNNIIPICLMIALETVKGIQVFFMSFDVKLFKDVDDKLKILSFRLHEDLGNIKYIFSDKTGTLTKNEMIFKACSIYNRMYHNRKVIGNNNNNEQTHTNTQIVYDDPNKSISFFDEKFDKQHLLASFNDNTPLINKSLDIPMIETIGDSTLYFFLNIILNHGVLTEKINNQRVFQGTNPDELVLIQAANELGISYIERIENIISISIFDHIVQYEVLHWFEFSSERLRSSILVKELTKPKNQEDYKYYLFMKGADSVILTNKTLNKFSYENLYSIEKAHIDNFAKEGLRTLCYCMKVIDKRTLEDFNKQYMQLKENAVKDKTKEAKLEQFISDLEHNMTLLGVTSLEDKLQDNLKHDIQEFIEAGIHVWMLTGDKMDTAESIAYSCKLFNNDTEIFKIKANNNVPLKKLLLGIQKQMEKIEEELNQKNEELKKMKYDSISKELKFSPEKIKQEDLIQYLANHFDKKNIINKEQNKEKRKKSQEQNCNEKNSNYSYTNNIKIKDLNRMPFKARPISSHLNKIMTQARNEQNLQCNEERKVNIDQINDRDIMEFISHKEFIPKENNKEHNLPNNNSNDNDNDNDNNSINSVIQDIIKTELKTSKDFNNNDNNDHHKENIQFANSRNRYDPYIKMNNHNYNESNILSSKKFLHSTLSTPVEEFRKNICEKLNIIEQQKRIQNFNFLSLNNTMNNKISNTIANDSLKNFGLIIEGISITKCMEESVENIFMSIIKKCRSVVCSRCAPIQKSDMVAFVKRKSYSSKGVTLAIGDGGNDVNMIKEADIGIGIFGKEGYQAAFNSDFAISKFKYLKRLMFYHGHYFLMRNSYFIYYFFYKSVIYTMIHFWFLFDNMCSSSIIYDESMFLIYNAVGSNIIVAIRAVLEQDIDIDFEGYPKRNAIKKLIPDIYREYRDKHPFSYLRFFIVFCLSFIQSMVIYYIPKFALLYGIVTTDGIMADYWTYSLLSYSIIIIAQTMVNIVDSFLYRPFSFFAYFLHIFFNMITIIINNYNALDQCGGISMILARNPMFWLIMLITFGICYFPYLFYSRFDMFYVYDIINDLRFGKYEYDIDKKVYLRKLERINKLKRLIMKFKKIYADNNYKADSLRDKQMKEMVEKYKGLKVQLKKDKEKDEEIITEKIDIGKNKEKESNNEIGAKEPNMIKYKDEAHLMNH